MPVAVAVVKLAVIADDDVTSYDANVVAVAVIAVSHAAAVVNTARLIAITAPVFTVVVQTFFLLITVIVDDLTADAVIITLLVVPRIIIVVVNVAVAYIVLFS